MSGGSTAPSAVKVALRERFRRYRESLDPDEYEARSRLIADEAALLPEISDAQTVHVYWPIVERREVDTRPLIAGLEAHNKRIVLPVVDSRPGERAAERQLIHVRFPGEPALVRNRWGILEPPVGRTVPPEEIDAVIVPALGAGRNGHRVGYGMGFYDAFLSRLDAPAICLVFAQCLVDFIPAEAHDRKLDVVVTEDETLRFADTG